jgi:hypothetical protein
MVGLAVWVSGLDLAPNRHAFTIAKNGISWAMKYAIFKITVFAFPIGKVQGIGWRVV